MSEPCGEQCPVQVAIEHTNAVMEGIGEPDVRQALIARWLHTRFDAVMVNQSCEESCRVLRTIIYSATVPGDSSDVLMRLPELEQEI